MYLRTGELNQFNSDHWTPPKMVFINENNEVNSKLTDSFDLLSFEMIHIKIVKGIYAYISCTAVYNSALHILNGFRNAIVSVDRSFIDHSTLRFFTFSTMREV